MEGITIFLLILVIVELLIIIGTRAHGCLTRMYTIRHKMIVYTDIEMTEKQGKLIMNLEHAKIHDDIWRNHEDELSFWAGDKKIPVRFRRCVTVDGRYRLIFDKPMDASEQLWFIRAVKYNELFISHDEGETKIKAHILTGKFVETLTKKSLNPLNENLNKDELIHNIVHSSKYYYIGADMANNDKIVSHIFEAKTTSNTMRFQAALPAEHPVMQEGFDIEQVKFYHTYDGYLYEIESKFLIRSKNLFEWELMNLQPFSVYIGLSYSIDGGKTVLPSSALYGLTRDEEGELPAVDEAHLAKPNPKSEKLAMWTKEAAIESLGKKLTLTHYDVIVKKQLEDMDPEAFIPIKEAREHHDKIDWLETGKEL